MNSKENRYKTAFGVFCSDDKVLTRTNLANFLRSLGVSPTKAKLEIIDKGVTQFNYESAMKIYTKLSRESEPDILKAFEVFDTDCTGYINVSELRHILTTYGETFDNSEIDAMLRQAEPVDGKINYVKYSKFLKKYY